MQIDGETDRQTDRQTDRWGHRQTDRWSHRQTDRQTDSQTDRQTDGQADGQKRTGRYTLASLDTSTKSVSMRSEKTKRPPCRRANPHTQRPLKPAHSALSHLTRTPQAGANAAAWGAMRGNSNSRARARLLEHASGLRDDRLARVPRVQDRLLRNHAVARPRSLRPKVDRIHFSGPALSVG